MALNPVRNSLFRSKIGEVPHRDASTTILSCLFGFLRLNEERIVFENLLGLAPLAHSGADWRVTSFLARRLGVELESVDPDAVRTGMARFPLLIQRDTGYCFLVLEKTGGEGYLVMLPGSAELFFRADTDVDVLDRATGIFALRMQEQGLRRKAQKQHTTKLFLLPLEPRYLGGYSGEAVGRLNASLSRAGHHERSPVPMRGLSRQALLASHRTICPSLPQYFGVFRKINLRRNHLFLDHAVIAEAIDALFEAARSPAPAENRIAFAARLLTDFLTIHPFVNGNRRMGMLVISAYFAMHRQQVEWERISPAQCYYWIRCAARGHFRLLERGLGAVVVPAYSSAA